MSALLAVLVGLTAPAAAERLVEITAQRAKDLGLTHRVLNVPRPLVAIPDAQVGLLPPGTPSYPNLACQAASPSNPDDPLFPLQSHLLHHDATLAWQLQPDADGVVVAVLDTGVAYEDWSDGSGDYRRLSDFAGTSFQPGWDFVNEDAHPNDDHHHGTHMAAIVAETTNNAFGAAALARGATILPVKVLDAKGRGTLGDVLEGLYFATTSGADVILLSFAFPASQTPGMLLDQALTEAREAGAVIVAAAGNEGAPVVAYPAASPACIAVGAAKSTGNNAATRARYSNFGTALDLVAFGGDGADRNGDRYPDAPLAQTFVAGDPLDEEFYFIGGTSAAAASVAGTVALLLAAGATPEAAEWHVLHGARDLERPGFDPSTGFGLLDPRHSIEAALLQPIPPAGLRATSTASLEVANGHKIRLRVDVEVTDAAGNPARKVRAYIHFRGIFGASASDDETDAMGRAHVFSPWAELDADTIDPISWGAVVDRAVVSPNRWDPNDVVPIEPTPGADLLIDHPIKDRVETLTR